MWDRSGFKLRSSKLGPSLFDSTTFNHPTSRILQAGYLLFFSIAWITASDFLNYLTAYMPPPSRNIVPLGDATSAVNNICRSCTRGAGEPCPPCKKHLRIEYRITRKAPSELNLLKLVARQEQCRADINVKHDPFMPHLPLEISAYIFRLSLPSTWGFLPDDKPPTSRTGSSPLILAAVSRTWRRIALSTPYLWATVPITLSNKADRNAVVLDATREFINRARNLPFSIWLFSCSETFRTSPAWEPIAGGIVDIFLLLNSFSARWKNLYVDIPTNIFSLFHIKSTEEAPLLDGLRIMNRRDLYEEVFGLRGTKLCPTFVYLSYSTTVDINWERVTDLEYKNYTLTQCLDILRSTPSLVRCSFKDDFGCTRFPDDPDDDEDEEPDPVTCIALRSLDIWYTGLKNEIFPTIPFTLATLVLPNLCDFSLSIDRAVRLEDIESLVSRSCCLLTSISLDCELDLDDGIENLVELLLQTPQLVKFKWSFRPILESEPRSLYLNRLFELLAEHSTQPLTSATRFNFLPNLTSLVIENIPQSVPLSLDWETVADIFESVPDGTGSLVRRPLNTFKMSFFEVDRSPILSDKHVDYIQKKDLLRLLRIAQTGVDLFFQSPQTLENMLKASARYHQVNF